MTFLDWECIAVEHVGAGLGPGWGYDPYVCSKCGRHELTEPVQVGAKYFQRCESCGNTQGIPRNHPLVQVQPARPQVLALFLGTCSKCGRRCAVGPGPNGEPVCGACLQGIGPTQSGYDQQGRHDNKCDVCGNDLGRGMCGYEELPNGEVLYTCMKCKMERNPVTLKHPNLGIEISDQPIPQHNDPRWSKTAETRWPGPPNDPLGDTSPDDGMGAGWQWEREKRQWYEQCPACGINLEDGKCPNCSAKTSEFVPPEDGRVLPTDNPYEPDTPEWGQWRKQAEQWNWDQPGDVQNRPEQHEWVPTEHLAPMLQYDRSEHDPERVEQVGESVDRTGFNNPVWVDFNPDTQMAHVSEGNHRLTHAIANGIPAVPVSVYRSHRVPDDPSILRQHQWKGIPGDHPDSVGDPNYVPQYILPSWIGMPTTEPWKAPRA